MKRRKMMPLGETKDGEVAMGVCESTEPGEEGSVILFKEVKAASADDEDLGTLKETDDGHVEFKSFEKDQPVEVEDHTKRSRKGPSKIATKAYRDGWDRVFKN